LAALVQDFWIVSAGILAWEAREDLGGFEGVVFFNQVSQCFREPEHLED
jgi:hypothetical protein